MIIDVIDQRISALTELSGITVGYGFVTLNDAGEGVSVFDTSEIPTLGYNNDKVINQYAFTIEVFARMTGRFIAMRSAITDSLHGFTGTIGTKYITSVMLLSDIPTVADRNGQIYRSIMNFNATGPSS